MQCHRQLQRNNHEHRLKIIGQPCRVRYFAPFRPCTPKPNPTGGSGLRSSPMTTTKNHPTKKTNQHHPNTNVGWVTPLPTRFTQITSKRTNPPYNHYTCPAPPFCVLTESPVGYAVHTIKPSLSLSSSRLPRRTCPANLKA